MADNNADFTKKVLVDVEVKAEQLRRDLPAIVKQIEDLSTANKKLAADNQKSSAAYLDNAAKIRQLKAEVRDYNKYIDTTQKAIHATTGTLEEQRAVLSLITRDYVKFGEASGVTKEQIDAFTDSLKKQEKQIGQTYRNVGNYSDAIREVLGEIGGVIPGFQQFTSAVSTATKVVGFLPTAIANVGTQMKSVGQTVQSFVGFKQFGNQATEAKSSNDSLAGSVEKVVEQVEKVKGATEGASKGLSGLSAEEASVSGGAADIAQSATEAVEGLESIGAGGVALTGILGGVALAIASVIAYLKDLDTFSDTVEQNVGGIGAAFSELGRGVLHGKLNVKEAYEAYNQQKELIEQRQALEDSQLNYSVESSKKLAQVYKLQVEAKNKTLDPGESQKLLDKATAIDAEDLKNKQAYVEKEISLVQNQMAITGHLTDYQKKELERRGVEYALYLQNNLVKQGKVTDSQTKQLAAALQKRTQIQQEFTQRDERRQNLEDARDQRDEQKKAAADAKAQAAAEKAERLKQAQDAAFAEAENIRKSSENRILQDIYEEYGDRAIAADQNYNNQLTQLKKFLAQKKITQQEYNSVEQQLTKEHQSAVTKIIDDFRKQDEAKYTAASQQLIKMHIQNIDNEAERSIAAAKESGIEQISELETQNQERLRVIKQLDTEIKNEAGKFNAEEIAEAKERRLSELSQLQINAQKKVEIQASTASAIDKINKKSLDDQNKLRDSNDVNEATTKFGANSSQELAAKQQQLLDNYNAEVSNEALTAAAKLEIERKYIADRDALDKQSRQSKIEYAAQIEQTVQSGISDIFAQNIQQREQQQLNNLSKQKESELANTSLTNTQKQLIDQKYKRQEDAVKLKTFKDNQKLQVANVLINGAVGISKTIAEMGFLPAIPFVALTAASTAFSVAKILSQKPAFATGGQFVSDGKGTVLPGYSRTDNTNAFLRSGEGVVVSEAMRVPWARNQISAINEMFGGRSFAVAGGSKPAFASGGIFTDGGNASRYYAQPVYDGEALANSLAYQLINNFPPVVVGVKDIINEQAIYVKTQQSAIL